MPRRAIALAAAVALLSAQPHAQPGPAPIAVRVDAARDAGPLAPVWAWFGYDEPNYTYMKDGQKLLTELAAASPVPVHVRAHNLLTTGDGTASLKWGSTNAYTEDANGRPVYDWTIVDRIFDTYVARGMKPLVEIGFMPEALTTGPPPYRHAFNAETRGNVFTGWAYPPKNYAKWAELVHQWVKHSVERYGRAEVESWWWELWNEPDIGYWKGTPEEYFTLYDYTADAVKRALPTAKIGGPHTTGPANEKARAFLRAFLEHCARGKNAATGRIGAPLDYIGFHAKGQPAVVDGHVRMGIAKQLSDIDHGFRTVASFPEYKATPIIIGESDPEGCAACSARFSPQNAYRNGTMYSSYTAASFPRKYELARRHGINLAGVVTWAFEFEDQPWFDGFRDLSTNGVPKPVLNVFRMFGLMGDRRIEATSAGAMTLDAILAGGVRGAPDVGVLASRGGSRVSALVWHYHDDDLRGAAAPVAVTVDGLPANASRVLVRRNCVDPVHGNSYNAWQAMGSPQAPTPDQVASLQRASVLAACDAPAWKSVKGGRLELAFELPRQGVSLVEVSW